jgi:hypothetical protein
MQQLILFLRDADQKTIWLLTPAGLISGQLESFEEEHELFI